MILTMELLEIVIWIMVDISPSSKEILFVVASKGNEAHQPTIRNGLKIVVLLVRTSIAMKISKRSLNRAIS